MEDYWGWIEEAEREVVVVIAPVDRVLLDVAKGVVHPPHVPLEAEAEAAIVGRVRDAAERSRLLGNRHDPR